MDVEFIRYKFEDGFSGVIIKQGFKIGVRHIQMLYMFTSAVVMGMIRGSLGIAVLSMADETRQDDTYIQVHVWDRRVQGAILSSFFFGYALMLLPAELFYKRLGGKLVVSIMLAVNGALCVAMPTIANRGGWVAVCNAMLLMGMAQTGFSVINQSLLERWLPPCEKNCFSFLIDGGIHLGMIIALPTSGLLIREPLGWELVYYSLAMLSLAMAIVYGILTASSSDDHQAIGDKEKEFIREALSCYSKKSIPKPWRSILTSPQFWAVVSAHTASNTVFVFYLADVPAYMKVFGFSTNDSALFAALPFATMWLVYLTTSPTLGWISNLRLVSYFLDVTNFRKLINILGAVGVVIGLTISSNLPSDWGNSAVLVLTITLALLGFQFSGFLSSYKDMSENHASTLVTLGSAVSSVVGAAVPFVTGLIVGDDMANVRRWRSVLLYLASLYVLLNIVYTMLSSNQRQNWDRAGTKFSHYNGIIDENQMQLDEFNGSSLVKEKHQHLTTI